VGDLREKNILVDDCGQICLVDCDSFQIIDEKNKRFFASQTYTPAYLAPEWIGKDLSTINRRTNDHFALAVWIFQMLMNGMHPYQARGGRASQAPSLTEKIKLGTYPYGSGRRLQPPQAAPDFNRVPRSIRRLFEASFVKGHKHPDSRPEAMDYAKVLKREIGRLKSCRKNSRHKYSGDLGTCPFCQKGTRPAGPAAIFITKIKQA
jgi:DNA-binding helix-hairpin-helix protein with protein kinase domain